MDITLKKINKELFYKLNDIDVLDEQSKFVARPYFFIAQSKFDQWIKNLAVCEGENLVGFLSYGFDPNFKLYVILEIVIDIKYQNRGYGKAAINSLINKIKINSVCDFVIAGIKPENEGSKKFFQSLGFNQKDIIRENHQIFIKSLWF
jgi:diamine N-acetyltransferase